SLGCCLYALCYFVSPFDLVYEKGNSVALAAQSPEKIQYPDVKRFDPQLVTVMRALLVVDPTRRMSIEEAADVVGSVGTKRADGQNVMAV
ncbi:hypothetical protein TELCIR_22991, partial [Teladorsagia circumcincta]